MAEGHSVTARGGHVRPVNMTALPVEA